MRRTSWVLACLGVVCGLWFMRAEPEVRANERVYGVSAPRPRAHEVLALAQLPPLPETFRETEVDGGFTLDAGGHLVPSESALQFFQYYFSASGRESEQVMFSRVVHAIRARLLPPADAEAIDLLGDFVRYRAAGHVLADELDDESPEERVARVTELRREIFGEAAAERMFGRDEDVRTVHMERARILADRSLSDFERTEALREANRGLPEDMRARQAESVLASQTLAEVERLRAEGASDADVFAVRSAELGEAAAERLAVYDERERTFHAALSDLQALEQRNADPGELETFIERAFAERERVRARALLEAGFPTH